ncbi:MAG TPA: PDZ domain-containing protein [Longimicrobiales bacterium]
MSKTLFTRAAIALVFAIGLARPGAAQIGEEVRPRSGDTTESRDEQLEHHRREMERHRVEMERHAREMREALMRAHSDSGHSYYRFSEPGDRFIYSARVRQPCARMGIAFSGDDTITVEEVREGSGAAEAGVRPGDVIVSIDGERANVRRMSELAEGLEVGDEVRLVVRRDGRERTLDVTAQEDVCPLRTMLSPEPFTVICATRDSSDDGVAVDDECEHEFVYSLREGMSELREKMPFRVFTEEGDSGTWIRFFGPDGPHDSIFVDLDSVRMMSEVIALQLDSLRRVIPFTFEMADSVRMLMPSIEMDLRDASEEMHAHGLMLRSLELGARALAGASLTELNDDLAEYFDADEGVLVTHVEDGTPAARAGLRGGDVIIEVNGDDVDDLGDVRRAAARAEGPLDLTVTRRGERRTVRISE